MRSIFAIVFISLILAGCATAPYGNFVKDTEGLNQQKIADDTVNKIIELYPPAKTRFELQQPTPDSFGLALIRGLRDRGYAILEIDPNSNKKQQEDSEIKDQVTSTDSGLPLIYILDRLSDTGMYHVQIIIGNEILVRPYTKESGNIIPAGYWVRKE